MEESVVGREIRWIMLNKIFTDWNLFRVVRLLIGGYILVDGIRSEIWLFALLGLIFTVMPLLNIGCCATGGCSTKPQSSDDVNVDDVIFEEVKYKE